MSWAIGGLAMVALACALFVLNAWSMARTAANRRPR